MEQVLRQPLQIVDSIFSSAVAGGCDPKSDCGITGFFAQHLQDANLRRQIPSLHEIDFDDSYLHSLVRFDGMVQDVLDHELFVLAAKAAASGALVTGRFRDTFSEAVDPMDSDVSSAYGDRRVVLCCVPRARSTCFRDAQHSQGGSSLADPRVHEDELDRVDAEGSDSGGDARDRRRGPGSASKRARRARVLTQLHIKLYGDESLKPGDYISVVGILSMHDDAMSGNRYYALHALEHNRLDTVSLFASPDVTAVDVRAAMIDRLSRILGGDALAAEMVLLHMLSRVKSRVGEAPIGKITLNLTHVSAETAHALADFFDRVFPFVVHISFDIASLQSMQLAPRKDHERNILTPGELQQPHGTRLIVDETRLGEGRLEEHGVRNVAALQTVAQWQKCPYDYVYYAIELECDMPVLILSGPSRSILGQEVVDVVLRMAPEASGAPAGSVFAALTALSAAEARVFASYLAHHREIVPSYGSTVSSAAESYFVDLRKRDPQASAADLHLCMTLAGLQAVSRGVTEVSSDHFSMAVAVVEFARARNATGSA